MSEIRDRRVEVLRQSPTGPTVTFTCTVSQLLEPDGDTFHLRGGDQVVVKE